MALRRSKGRSIPQKSRRRTSIWVGTTTIVPTGVSSGAVAIVEVASQVLLSAIGVQGHIARTRARLLSKVTTVDQDPVIGWGIGVFPEGMNVATQCPSVLNDTRESYFAWGVMFALSDGLFTVREAAIMPVDSRGKRRYDNDDRIVLFLEGGATGHGASVFFDIACLVIPDV